MSVKALWRSLPQAERFCIAVTLFWVVAALTVTFA